MPVAKNGDRYTYIPPTAHACPLCGVAVVYEYGSLDAGAYRDGRVVHHLCALEVEPLNERRWRELTKQPEPVAAPPAPPPPRRRQPAQRLDEQWLR